MTTTWLFHATKVDGVLPMGEIAQADLVVLQDDDGGIVVSKDRHGFVRPAVDAKPMVYLAGPYTAPDPAENTHLALAVAGQMLRDGLVVPFVPHLSLFWQVVRPQPYERWLEYDLDVIRHCQGLLRMSGESPGADREVALAHELGIPVFASGAEVAAWALAQ